MLMKIGSVVDELGIPASTLRYYEKIGLIKPLNRISNSRRFDDDSILKLQFIQMAKSAGFTIEEIRRLLNSFATGTELSSDKSHVFAKAKLTEVRQKIQHFRKMETVLNTMMKCECVSLKSCVQYATTKPINNR